MILYVMRTFLALRHMGRVLCVTDQVPWSHSSGGHWKVVEEGRVGLYFLGERSVIAALVEVGAVVGGTSTAIVVTPGDSPCGRVVPAILNAFCFSLLELLWHQEWVKVASMAQGNRVTD